MRQAMRRTFDSRSSFVSDRFPLTPLARAAKPCTQRIPARKACCVQSPKTLIVQPMINMLQTETEVSCEHKNVFVTRLLRAKPESVRRREAKSLCSRLRQMQVEYERKCVRLPNNPSETIA